jgi:peptidoglycan/xylan/chitin deacetylase (PgdA/CDA1 family)
VTGRLGGTNTWDEAEGSGTLHLMTAEQIRSWAEQGIEFGAHSRTHPDLTKLSTAECSAEVAGSKSDLSALLGSPVVSFAYPYGECNDAVRDLVRLEFDLAFSVEEGMNYLRGDPHLLRRAYIGPKDSLTEFGLIVRLGGLNNLRSLYRRFGIRTRIRRAIKSAIGFAKG